jgi:hypothetical protein
MSYGAQIKFGIARQTSTGSGQATTAPGSFHHMPLISEDVGLEKDEVISQNLTGRFEQGATYDGVNRINGTIEFEATPKALGAVLTAMFGPAVSVTSASLRSLTFLPTTVDYSATFIQQPMTVYKQWSDASSAEHYFDCQFGQLEFTFAQGQLLRARTTVSGGSRVATGVGSLGLTLDTGDLSLGFLWDATSISYGGSAVGQYSEVTIAINENIEPLYSLNGTLAPYKFTRTSFREVTVNGTLYFADRAALNDFVIGAQRRLVVTTQARKTAIQSGYYATLSVDVPQLKITQFKPGVSGPGEVSVSFTGRGVLDPTSNYSLQVLLINTYANAY